MIRKALIVNDDNITLFIAGKMLKISDFSERIVTAHNGLAALEYYENAIHIGFALSEDVPEFIFLDFNMPYMGGIEFLEVFTRKYAPIFPNVRVAILSSSADENDIDEARKYDVVIDFVEQPICISKLEELKKAFLNKQETGFHKRNVMAEMSY